MPLQKVDLHSHTNHSDGACTVREMINISQDKNMILAVTDHNVISAALEAQQIATQEELQRIVGGCEMQSQESAELLLYGNDIGHLADFYRQEIEKANLLHPTNPVFEPVRTSFATLIGKAKDWELQLGLPHMFLRLYGMKSLNRKTHRAVLKTLRSYRDHVFVERNPHVSCYQNYKAMRFADKRRNRFPIVTTSDEHGYEHSSYTWMPIPESSSESLAPTLFASLHKNPPPLQDQHLEHHSAIRSAKNSAGVLWQMGRKGAVSMMQREIRHQLGW